MKKDQLSDDTRATNSVPRARVFVACALSLVALGDASAAESRARQLRYEVVATHAHDAQSFTQGLAFLEGKLVESTGLYRQSALWLKSIDGAVTRKKKLDNALFGEGVAVDGARIVQLTWQSGLALVYDLAFNHVGAFRYSGEGWGLAFDGRQWLMSDGSSRILRRARRDFAQKGAIAVRDGTQPVTQLNELEYANGVLYANVWHSDRIAAIDPSSGAVRGWLDLAALRQGFPKPAGWNEADHVLNGIAFNPANAHFYVTGKCWPVLFEIRLLPGP
jgi:glutaminyl-peptide cyclotransferase